MAKTAMKKINAGKVPPWRDETAKGRIKPSAYAMIIEWLALPDEAQRGASLHLLVEGLPSGSIKSATPLPALNRIAVVAEIADDDRTKPGSTRKWNTPRLFDPETFALMRLLTAYHGRIYLSNRQATAEEKKEGSKLFYPAVNLRKPNDNVPIGRLVWGSTTQRLVKQRNPISATPGKCEVGTHYDWGLENLTSKEDQTNKGTEEGPRKRKAVLREALRYRREREAVRKSVSSRNEKKLILLTTVADYRAAIQRCFALLDELRATVLERRKD